MNNSRTSCKNCIFAIYDNITQVGCEQNRLEKFGNDVIEAYDTEKEFYLINRVCNTFRNNTWNKGKKDINKARKESCISFDLLIDVNDINESYYDIIKNTLNNIDYPKNKYRIIFYHMGSIEKSKKYFISKLYQIFPHSMISVYFNKYEYLNSLIVKSKNSFHVLVNEQNISNLNNAINKSDKYINDDLNKFIVAQYLNITIISNLVCKFLYPYLYFNYDENIDNLILSATKQNLYIELQDDKK
jgi:hypothetical protein